MADATPIESLVTGILEGRAALRVRSAAARGALPLPRTTLVRLQVALLRDEEIISTNEEEKLEFNEKIQQLSNDAKFILSKEIRHGILRAAPQVPGAQSKHQDPE